MDKISNNTTQLFDKTKQNNFEEAKTTSKHPLVYLVPGINILAGFLKQTTALLFKLKIKKHLMKLRNVTNYENYFLLN